jgi:dipeptidase E
MIFLTSNTPPVVHDLYERYLKDLNIKTLVFIETAAEIETGDMEWLEADYDALVGVGLSVTRYTVSGKSSTDIEKDLSAYDSIYLSGGNTFYLLQQLQKTGAIPVIQKLMKEGKIYIGTSAGSVVAGPDILPVKNLDNASKAPELQGYAGLSLTDIVVLPHWGSSYFRDLYLNQRLDHVYDNPVHKIVLLTDTQYLVCEESGSVRIVDAVNK